MTFNVEWIRMRPIDLIKATVFCGLTAFLAYSYPALSQGLIIGCLSLLWLSYLYRVVMAVRAR